MNLGKVIYIWDPFRISFEVFSDNYIFIHHAVRLNIQGAILPPVRNLKESIHGTWKIYWENH